MKTKDQIVRELLDVLEQKKLAIAKAEKPKWETNCSFGYRDSAKINIQTVSDPAQFVNMLSFLITESKNFEEASKILGVSVVFTWLGFTVDEWTKDFITRVNKIQINEKKQEFLDLEKRLDKLVSKEERERLELEDIQNKLLK